MIPQWILNLLLKVILPFLWKKVLATLDVIIAGQAINVSPAGGPTSDQPLLERLITDETGLYRMIRKSTEQLFSTGSGAGPSRKTVTLKTNPMSNVK